MITSFMFGFMVAIMLASGIVAENKPARITSFIGAALIFILFLVLPL